MGAAWLCLLALTGLFIWASTWLRPPRPVSLMLMGAGYQDNLAIDENVFGWQSLMDMSQLVREDDFSSWGKHLLKLRGEPLQWRTDTPWQKSLADGPENTLVVVMAMQGGADLHGAFLLPQNANVEDNPTNRIRLTAVLKTLSELPASKQKVLILDCTAVASNWQLGMLRNDFARELRELIPRIEAIPNLVVLSSSDVDQRSWACREYRRTVFLHYVIEGLKGGARDEQNDGRIDLLELHQYVQENVRRWTQFNRGVLQTPVLLPEGLEGKQRASRIDLAVATSNYRPPDPHATPVYSESPELSQWWQSHAKLAQQLPSPMAHSPQLWRQYQDTLLRCERLVLAGDLDAANSLSRELLTLEVAIQQARILSLNCSQNTLSMPAVSGVLPTLSDAAQQAVSQLWNAPAAEASQCWNGLLQKAQDSNRAPNFGQQVATMLYERATADPVTNLAKATSLLQIVEDPLFPNPAEVHFLTMLRLGLPNSQVTPSSTDVSGSAAATAGSALAGSTSAGPASAGPALAPSGMPAALANLSGAASSGPTLAAVKSLMTWPSTANPSSGSAQSSPVLTMDAELITLALTVRKLAERTAVDGQPGVDAYSGIVYPWIAAQIQASDTLRRAGEDLLFAGQAHHQLARQKLMQAEAGYQQAWAAAVRVREACHIRNHAFASLPYYAHWLAGRITIEEGISIPNDALLSDMQTLWAAAHELSLLLTAQPAANPVGLGQQLQALAEKTESVKRGLDTAASRCQTWWWDLSAVELPSVWHEARAALNFPQEDPALRAKLRGVLCKTSRQLLIESTQSALYGSGGNISLPPVSPQTQSRMARLEGRRQGLMALAVLGKHRFDQGQADIRVAIAASADLPSSPTPGPELPLPQTQFVIGPTQTPITPSTVASAPQATTNNSSSNKLNSTVAGVVPGQSQTNAKSNKTPHAGSRPASGAVAANTGGSMATGSSDSADARLSTTSEESYEEVVHRLQVFSVEENWWVSLNAAGEQIGRRWWQMAPDIQLLMQASQKAIPWTQQVRQLQAADRICRLMTGAAASQLSGDPAAAYRHVTTAQLLLHMAQRSWFDHWYSVDPQAVPYYRVAATAFLDDAARLATPKAEISQWQKLIQMPGNLMLTGPRQINLTTEQQHELVFQVGPAAGAIVPDGAPVLWVETTAGVEAAAPQAGERHVRSLDAKTSTGRFVCVITSPTLAAAMDNAPPRPQVVDSSVTANAWFRGQRFDAQAEICLHLCPNLVVQRPAAPEQASVTVRAAPDLQQQFGGGTGAVAIVLDVSGSMGPPPGSGLRGSPAGPSAALGSNAPSASPAAFKYTEATQALNEVLQKLPSGTVVSVWVFGQAMGSNKTVDDANRTVTRIQDPIVWNSEDRSQLSRLMAAVRYPVLEPWNESPIVRAMLMAKQDLVGAPGFKSLVVLTDGQDNCFATDKRYNPDGRDIPTALRDAFASSGIIVNIVGFKVEAKERSAALQQFKSVEDWSPPGRFITVDNAQSLADLLHSAMRQRMRYWVENYDTSLAPGMPANGLDVTLPGANDQWYPGGLWPGSYLARTFTDRLVQANFGLNRGDLLILELSRGPRGVQFGRMNYSQSDFPWKPYRETGAWRMSLLQNQQLPQQALQMLVTLESTPQSHESTLQVIRPREVWLEVEPVTTKDSGPVAVQWGYQYGYPAPAWTINVPAWPEDTATANLAPPRIHAWWNPDQSLVPSASLDRGHDFTRLSELSGQSLQVGQDEITIEGVDVEPHLVQVGPGHKEMRNCLVVRFSQPPGRAIAMDVAGLTPAASELRFYRDIGRSTALFWPVTTDEAARALNRLQFFSVEEFKARAERRGFSLKLNQLPPPAASDARPLPYQFSP